MHKFHKLWGVLCRYTNKFAYLRPILYIHKRNENPSKKMDASSCLKKLDDLLKLSLGHLKKDFDRLRNGLIKRKDYIFNFLENPAIPSNNNGSERGIRKLKIKQKISGTFRSDNGADAFMTIHSISDTA